MAKQTVPPLPLPKNWTQKVRSAAVHAIALARLALTTALGQANSADPGSVRIARLTDEFLLIKEEMRIKDGRMAGIHAQRRPDYLPFERLAILQLRAARGWSQSQTAERMLITPATVAAWTGRLDEEGPTALVQMREPVNRFPDFVVYLVRRLKTLSPTMGKVRIAQFLARAGLHLGSTTVARMLAAPTRPRPTKPDMHHRAVRSTRPNQIWNVDLILRPDGCRVLGALAAVGSASALAFLLVGRRHRGSLLAADNGCRRLHPEPNQCRRPPDARQGHQECRVRTFPPHHGSGHAVHRRGLPQVVQASRYTPAFRGRPEIRQHLGDREADADHEERGAPSHSRAVG